MSIDISKDRHELNDFHSLSNGTGSNPDRPSRISHGQSVQSSIWKAAPTRIQIPGAERKTNPTANPYSAIRNEEPSTIRLNPSTLSLVPVTRGYHHTPSTPLDKPPAPKKPRLNAKETANRRGNVHSLGVVKSGPFASASVERHTDNFFPSKSGGKGSKRKKSAQAKPLARADISEIIDVDGVDEDLGDRIAPPSESSDDLRLRDGEQPGQDHIGSSTIQTILELDPPPSQHPFTLRKGHDQFLPPPEGPRTSALKAEIGAKQNGHASTNGSESDPIEYYEENKDLRRSSGAVRRTRKATPSGVTEFNTNFVRDTVKEIDKKDFFEAPPAIDLHTKAQRNKVGGMKPKLKAKLQSQSIRELRSGPQSANPHSLQKPPRKRQDSIATSSTNFLCEGNEEELILPIEKWISGTHIIDSTVDCQITQHWLSVKNDHVSIVNLPMESSTRSLVFQLVLQDDIIGVTVSRDPGDKDEFPYLKFHVRNTDRLKDLFKDQEDTEIAVHVKFLQEHPNWKTQDYERMVMKFRSSSCASESIDAHARRALWQSLEHVATPVEASTLSTHSTRPRPTPRPPYAEARSLDHSGGLPRGSSSSSDPRSRRSTRNVSNVSQNLDRPRSPPADETILLYPPTGTGAVNVTHGDLKRLEPGEFLNDTLIELGLKLWLNEIKASKPELAEQIHVFSSFFYTQLNHKNIEEGYQSVRKWTSKFDLFKKKYVIVPINERMHWYLAIICYPDRALYQQTSTQPVMPNVTTRRRLRESLSKDESYGKPMSQGRAATPPLGISKPTSTSSKSVAGDEQEVEKIVIAPIHPSAHISSSPLTIATDSSEEMIIPETESEGEEEHGVSSVSMKVDHPSLQQPFPTLDTVPTTSFYGSPDVNMRSVSVEEEQKDEVDELETDSGMEIDEPPSVVEPAKLDQPYIFTFDSLGARHPRALALLSQYLDLEAKDKKALSQTTSAIKKLASVPTQPNYCDCGIYLLHFVEQFMTDPETFTRRIADNAKSRKSSGINREDREALWNHAVVASKRENLKQTIMSLASDWKRGKEADGKDKGKPEDEPSNPQAESTAVDHDSDIEVLDMTPEPSKTIKGARSRTPAPHKAQRIR